MHVVLLEPEIPPNTGNVARLCAATGSTLHLVEPLGFKLDDRRLRRAGLDYWDELDWRCWPNWPALIEALGSKRTYWLIESRGPRRYADVSYSPDDVLVFGRETAGLPEALLQEHSGSWLNIPMANPRVRSLNLSNCVALVLFEALRQLNFPSAGYVGLNEREGPAT